MGSSRLIFKYHDIYHQIYKWYITMIYNNRCSYTVSSNLYFSRNDVLLFHVIFFFRSLHSFHVWWSSMPCLEDVISYGSLTSLDIPWTLRHLKNTTTLTRSSNDDVTNVIQDTWIAWANKYKVSIDLHRCPYSHNLPMLPLHQSEISREGLGHAPVIRRPIDPRRDQTSFRQFPKKWQPMAIMGTLW